MSEKRNSNKLSMGFSEALARLARTPKAAIDAVAGNMDTKNRKTKASGSSPRPSRRKTA